MAISPSFTLVTGPSGSGTEEFAANLADTLKPSPVALLDERWYLKKREISPSTIPVAPDLPLEIDSELLLSHVDRLKENIRIQFEPHTSAGCPALQPPSHIENVSAVIIYGKFLLSNQALRKIADFSVYIESPPEYRLARILLNVKNYKDFKLEEFLARYIEKTRPAEIDFCESTRQLADIIIPELARNKLVVETLKEKLRSLVLR